MVLSPPPRGLLVPPQCRPQIVALGGHVKAQAKISPHGD